MKTKDLLIEFINYHIKIIEPIYNKYTQAVWNAEVSGKQEYYDERKKYGQCFDLIYSSSFDYNRLKQFKNHYIWNSKLKRQLKILLDSYKSKQIPEDLLKKMRDKSVKINMDFNTFRGIVDGKKVSQNEIEFILNNELNSETREKYWNAQKSVGEKVHKNLLELVKLRNESARKLGYDNYYVMSLELQEIDSVWLKKVFDELYQKTEKSFREVKKKIDESLAKKFKISLEEIMPWHYSDPFFQSCPIAKENYDSIYAKHDIIDLTKQFYKGMGMPIDEILKKSDLYEKKNKCPHAFCISMNKKGDVRILMNAANNVRKMGTILHEAGHAVYDLGIDQNLPFILRDPAHTFVTEAIAMMFGKLAYDGKWMQAQMNLSDKDAQKFEVLGKEIIKSEQLVLSRWMQVMVNFERELYNDPDQDLNSLWWELVNKYQHIKKPKGRDKPDYASKIHISTSPVYYHNYQLGELLASQIQDYMVKKITFGKPFNNNPNVGPYLTEKIFKPGASMRWDKLIKSSTGKKLKTKYFIKQYC